MCLSLIDCELLTQELVSPGINLIGVGTLELICRAEVSSLDVHLVPKVEHESALELCSQFLLLLRRTYLFGTDGEAHHAEVVDGVHRNRKHIVEALPLHRRRIVVQEEHMTRVGARIVSPRRLENASRRTCRNSLGSFQRL